MNPQGNTMQPPAPLARKAERVLMTIAAAYNVIMASITLFMFTSWFKGQAYDLLEHNGLLKTDYSAVDNASTVVGIYALLVLIIGIVSFIMSMRCLAPGTTSRWVIIWLAIVVVFSLGTMDLIGLALYSITLVIYLARNKAIAAQQDVIRTWARTHQANPPSRRKLSLPWRRLSSYPRMLTRYVIEHAIHLSNSSIHNHKVGP